MKKSIFKNNSDDIHIGINAAPEFQSGNRKDVGKVLESLGEKKIWRCSVCNDLHIGLKPPVECPTCHVRNAYVEIELGEFKKLLEIL